MSATSRVRKRWPKKPTRRRGLVKLGGDKDLPNTDGADTNAVVTNKLIATATKQLTSRPSFWGRYFKGPGDQNPVRYQAHLESALLRSNGIRVLPIAQQTKHVAGDRNEGRRDGLKNGAAIIASFGNTYLSSMAEGILVFLDVEGDPSLSSLYYRGWSEGLINAGRSAMVETAVGNEQPVRFLPCIYGSFGDDDTWRAIQVAIAQGAICAGAWIARPGRIGCHPLESWDEARVRPNSLPRTVQILAWQNVQECANVDYNRANPSGPDLFLSRLILPPDVSKGWLTS